MHRKSIRVTLMASVLSLSTLTGAATALAADQEDLAVMQASVDITKAIATAEKHIGGKACSAEFQRERGQTIYEVDVVKDQTVTEVHIDATNGNVISSTPEKVDRK